MNRLVTSIVGIVISGPIAVIIWPVCFYGFGQSAIMSTLWSISGGVLVFFASSLYMSARFLKKHGLSRKEYQYIKGNIKEAKSKIFRACKALLSIRHLPSLKERIELVRMIRKIYSLTKKEPKRFYQAEKFYFSHLDSTLELAEKYVFLASQPKKNKELDLSLIETRRTLEQLTKLVEEDLYEVISNDIQELDYEIDVAKQTLKNTKESSLINGSRKWK
ncbi:5-bromo-4-chloroindolyl phosphate hydrolysis family protein [Peribacillus huizhouensis]|uniref:5-bromo-4-chloroindolyl phosphate hydrolysis protein n=1 Tax=Peribacillus huizhouensis TaxID=1501239 RepID=A0ABR6CUU5_9BACI|nr:5-bromo-4-chloroindolyl phosphate hydrolysis family protein [Peribacillus huizhouensis]MBA9028734.1 5-bromo-4-chloroindolyl phosphate hydrolysis protein [Peribacillus huizhouensis]